MIKFLSLLALFLSPLAMANEIVIAPIENGTLMVEPLSNGVLLSAKSAAMLVTNCEGITTNQPLPAYISDSTVNSCSGAVITEGRFFQAWHGVIVYR